MSPRLKLRHTPRYRQLVALLVKHGRGDLIRSAGIDPELPDEEVPGDPDAAASLADDLEAMGPTFVKLGQMMSTRVDLFSPAYIDALSRLQDDVAPFAYDEVERLVSSELGSVCRRCSRVSTRNRWRRPRWARCTGPLCATGATWW